MPTNHIFLGLSLENWAAIATIANVATVVVLVVINILYLKSARTQANASIEQAKQSQRQADAASDSLRILQEKSVHEQDEQLVRVGVVLQSLLLKVSWWRYVVNDKCAAAPPTVKFLPDDWHSIVYNVGRLSAQLRDDIYFVGMHLADATAAITRILNMQPDHRASADFAAASRLLDETAPRLSSIVADIRARRKSAHPVTL